MNQVAELGKVGVLYGGVSAEREVSLVSGDAVLGGLQRAGVDVIGIDAQDNVVSQLQAASVDRIFNILHGGAGENGQIQGVLDCLNIPYTGSGVLGSAVSMDKMMTKRIWQAEQLPTLPFYEVHTLSDLTHAAEALSFPLAVKPATDGSSMGVSRVDHLNELPAAFEKASTYGPVMVEPWLSGGEYTVGIVGSRALPSIRIEASKADPFYDYNAKYHSDETGYYCPSGLDASLEADLLAQSLKAFQCLSCQGWGRVDWMRDHVSGEFYLLEVNTTPGMTSHSLLPRAAKAIGWSFEQLVVNILAETLECP